MSLKAYLHRVGDGEVTGGEGWVHVLDDHGLSGADHGRNHAVTGQQHKGFGWQGEKEETAPH